MLEIKQSCLETKYSKHNNTKDLMFMEKCVFTPVGLRTWIENEQGPFENGNTVTNYLGFFRHC